jgi:hypothetical protein
MQGANKSREATTAGKPTTAGRPTTAGTARNVGNTSSRRDLNSNREDNNSKDFSHGRYFRDGTAYVGTHQQQTRQQHKRQLEQQGTPTTAGMPKPVETSVEEGLLTTVGTPQQNIQ